MMAIGNANNLELPQIMASSYASNTVDTALLGNIQRFIQPNPFAQAFPVERMPVKEPIPMANTQRRLIQIFIADPDENVPLDQCLLYSGEQKLTDLTDQELFFEVDVKSLLDKHNKARSLLVNKAVKERTEHLEPARVRDLKMTVVTIAQF
jgi:hypothetical protein